MTNYPVIARLKAKQPGEPIRFSRTGSVEELLEEINRAIPCDMIYFLVPNPDGKGYTLREAGRVIIDLQVDGHQLQFTPPEPPSPIMQMEAHHQPEPPPSLPSPDEYAFDTSSNDGMSFTQPRPQAELLAERGLEVPPPPKTQPSPNSGRLTRSGKSKKGGKKTKLPTQDPNDRDDPTIPDHELPHPRAGRSSRSVRSISTATPAQAAAASHFKGF